MHKQIEYIMAARKQNFSTPHLHAATKCNMTLRIQWTANGHNLDEVR